MKRKDFIQQATLLAGGSLIGSRLSANETIRINKKMMEQQEIKLKKRTSRDGI